jgi:hypothetical protein
MLKGEAIFDVVLLSGSRIHQILRFIVHGFSRWCERCRAADPLRESLLANKTMGNNLISVIKLTQLSREDSFPFVPISIWS